GGTRLILTDRDAGGLAAVAERLGTNAVIECLPVDFTDLEVVDATIAKIVAEHPDIDLLVAVAGLDRGQTFTDFDWRRAREDFNVNTLANLVLLQHLVPAMTARGRGHVTAIASLAALIGTPYEGVYSATKAALGRLLDSARGELRGSGVTFTTVYPGFIDTPLMWANVYEHPYVVPLDEAADRIHEATVKRKAEIYFPARERLRIAAGRLLPAWLRDRIAKRAMNADVAGKLAGENEVRGGPSPAD
ncbi:MAG: SDR family NAD(P)-dependent oxidoreductase, partial [Actinobacteria bacterium]|nr:SDR family NAD(P)-dependent oxidoreductase [Actinomycetota bacterium]